MVDIASCDVLFVWAGLIESSSWVALTMKLLSVSPQSSSVESHSLLSPSRKDLADMLSFELLAASVGSCLVVTVVVFVLKFKNSVKYY